MHERVSLTLFAHVRHIRVRLRRLDRKCTRWGRVTRIKRFRCGEREEKGSDQVTTCGESKCDSDVSAHYKNITRHGYYIAATRCKIAEGDESHRSPPVYYLHV